MKGMAEDIRARVIERLQRDYGMKVAGSARYLRGGKCPNCGKKELYASHDAPWVIRCGRQEKCGREWHVKDLYDDLFDDWSRRFPQTTESPTAAADAYLRYSRGFDLAPLAGLYTQDHYYNGQLKAGSATVRFALERGGWWERIIDRPHRFGKRKAGFQTGASYKGVWWCAPMAAGLMKTAPEVWIVEGIFDAIALLQHGICAVAALSSNAYPEDSLKALAASRPGHLPKLVWALDNEPGAHAYTVQHAKRAARLGFECDAAQIPQRTGRKVDWNDLHLRTDARGGGDDTAADWAAEIDEARYHGALLLAATPMAKGLLMYRRTQRREFPLRYGSRVFWFSFSESAFQKMRTERAKSMQVEVDEIEASMEQELMRAAAGINEIFNCVPEVLYFQRHEVTDEAWYFLRVLPGDGRPAVKGTFTSQQVLKAPAFQDRLAALSGGALFEGTQNQLIAYLKEQFTGIKTVQSIDFVGYSIDHGAWLLGDVAVRQGEVIPINAEDFFEFDKLQLKSTQKSIRLCINPDPDEERGEWLDWLWTCFGTHGIVALAFWFGSLFAEQIRDRHESFPFLEMTGEAGSGKTTLITFLWKLFGRKDYEGFDPAKSSSPGRARAMGQTSNMPSVLLEADRSAPDKAHARSFDWDELKDYYGGGTLRTRGVRNGGNDTYEPPFRGTIVISQNQAVEASEAIITRIVKLHFVRPQATGESRIAADNLNALRVENVSQFLLRALRAEASILDTVTERSRFFEGQLRARDDLRIERVIKNHAQMLALLDALRKVVKLSDEMVIATRNALVAGALERQQAISADHPLVQEFWEAYEYLEATSDMPSLNHSNTPETQVALNLNEMAQRAAFKGQKLADLNILRGLLRESRRYRWHAANVAVNSRVRRGHSAVSDGNTILKCWVFDKR